MCSLLALLELPPGASARPELRARAVEASQRMRHRGPDWSGVFADERTVLVHERLSIVDVESGAQPLRSPDGRLVLAVNGEIYDHQALRRTVDYPFTTGSDCEVLLPLWRDRGVEFLGDLDGIFAFVAYDTQTGDWLVARDAIGVIPLYMGRMDDGTLVVASEMKGLIGLCSTFEEFPPGAYLKRGDTRPTTWYQPRWRSYDAVAGAPFDPSALRRSFEAAVERQLMCDVPYGVLLSGGLDSSLVAATAAKFARRRIETHGVDEAWWPRLHSFAIGLAGSPDVAAAKTVAAALGTVHHTFTFTLDEGLDALSEVIRHIETYDVTTIRASTPMFLMARRIKAMGIKMVLSGEGSDEIFGGYLYFHKAPNAQALHEETVRKLDALHWFDCLRANKSMAAWGIEARVPFLDTRFLDVAMSIDPVHKLCTGGRIEKHALRSAFEGVLPKEILWRQKEQFSDGVGYSWIDTLKAQAAARVSDEQIARASWRFPHNTPLTKEAYFYREIFERHYPGAYAAACVPGGPSVACSTPAAIEWDAAFKLNADPSGRAVRDVHAAAQPTA